jgi:hypothetical protein
MRCRRPTLIGTLTLAACGNGPDVSTAQPATPSTTAAAAQSRSPAGTAAAREPKNTTGAALRVLQAAAKAVPRGRCRPHPQRRRRWAGAGDRGCDRPRAWRHGRGCQPARRWRDRAAGLPQRLTELNSASSTASMAGLCFRVYTRFHIGLTSGPSHLLVSMQVQAHRSPVEEIHWQNTGGS